MNETVEQLVRIHEELEILNDITERTSEDLNEGLSRIASAVEQSAYLLTALIEKISKENK